MTSDRERVLIQQYDDAHRAWLQALEVVREAVFGNGGSAGRAAKSQVTKAKNRLDEAQRELQDFWLAEAQAQEVSR
jgi:hypothetical protein